MRNSDKVAEGVAEAVYLALHSGTITPMQISRILPRGIEWEWDTSIPLDVCALMQTRPVRIKRSNFAKTYRAGHALMRLLKECNVIMVPYIVEKKK